MKTFSAILLVLGLGVFLYGSYLSQEVTQGNQKISQAEENEQNHRRPLFGPIRKNMNEEATETAQGRINHAEQNLIQLQMKVNWLHGSGVILVVVGLSTLIYNFVHTKNRL